MRKEYIVLSKAWYGKPCLEDEKCVEEITLTVSDDDDVLLGDISMQWLLLNNRLCAKINMFYDTWKLFSICNDFFLELSKFDNEEVSVQEFIDCLNSCGFTDSTPLTKNK